MATDLKWLQGKIAENPRQERKDLDRLLVGFLNALVEEQMVKAEGMQLELDPAKSGAV